MPVPVPHRQPRQPSHQIIKPPPLKGNVFAPAAAHDAPQYVIQGVARQSPHSVSTAETGSRNWTDSRLSKESGQDARHSAAAQDKDEFCLTSAAGALPAQEPVGSAAGRLRCATGHRSSPEHFAVLQGERTDSEVMTWLTNLDSLPPQAVESDYEVEPKAYTFPPIPLNDSAEALADPYEFNGISRLPIKWTAPTFDDNGVMDADNHSDAHMSAYVGGGIVTPFATYIDRISAKEEEMYPEPTIPYVVETSAPPAETPRRQKSRSPERVTDPVYIKAYQSLAGSLSEWMSEYVWKVCTKGMSLPPRFVGMRNGRFFSERPPTQLADSIRSVLCATLLQPSCVALALWYISRLPVFVEQQVPTGTLTADEIEFRNELFGSDSSFNNGTGEFWDGAPFRVILLGCMLANKWLDDHTYSNKTWHSVSAVPIKSINRLEFLALGVLSHDLSVPPQAWEQWLDHLRAYHANSSPFPSPIRRPSTTDSNSLVRKLIDDLFVLQGESNLQSAIATQAEVPKPPEPVFSDLLAKEDERVGLREPTPIESYDIDLDEDGPLRAEYVPRRRSSQRSSYSNSSDWSSSSGDVSHLPRQQLPPPASWVPQEDPPIERQQIRRNQYIAVAPAVTPGLTNGGPFAEVQPQQPWWMEEQNRMVDMSRQNTINSVNGGWYTGQAIATHSYPTSTIAPPLSYTRSTLAVGPTSALVQLRSYSYSRVDYESGSLPLHCGGSSMFPSAYRAQENGAPFSFRPQYLRA